MKNLLKNLWASGSKKAVLLSIIFMGHGAGLGQGTDSPPQIPDAQAEGPINLTQYGFKKTTFNTSIGEMAVFEMGEGAPLLLLHGLGAGASSFIWFTLAPELAKNYRVIAPDFVGWGDSERPARELLFEDYVQQISELGAWIGAPTTVFAQSLSTGFAMSAANQGKIVVSKMVLLTPSGGFDFGVDAFGKQATAGFVQMAMSPQREDFYKQFFHQKRAVEDWWRREGFLNGEDVPEKIIEANFYNAKRPNASYSALPFLSGTLRYDIEPILKGFDIPAIILWGEKEFRIRPEVREKISAVNPEIESYEIADARTAFEIEQPAKTLGVIEAFIQE